MPDQFCSSLKKNFSAYFWTMRTREILGGGLAVLETTGRYERERTPNQVRRPCYRRIEAPETSRLG